MFTRKKIVLGMAGAVALAVSGAAVAAPAGDHALVYKPKVGAVAESSTPTIYWRYKTTAQGYLIDLVGKNTAYQTCNGATVKQMYVSVADAACGSKTSGDVGNGDGGFGANTPLCRWTSPMLGDGKYAVSVFPWDFTGQFANTNINEFVFRTNGPNNCLNGNYQEFQVAAATNPPAVPTIVQPVNGVDCSEATGNPGLPGPAGCYPTITNVTGDASWYQIWINDKNGVPVQNKWYKSSQLSCATAGGVTKCAFPNQQAKVPGLGSPYTFWVRAWNPAGNSSWTSPEVFTEDGVYNN